MQRSEPRLILASASPRREHLMRQMGLTFDTVPAAIDESPREGERPDTLVRRLAVTKAVSVGQRHPEAVVVGADTVVALGNEILGKPPNEAHARQMLSKLGGRKHQVYTGVAVWRESGNKGYVAVSVAQVTFCPLSALDIDGYIESGEPFDKAGGYAIQGLAGKWVQAFEGNLETVIGLPTDMVQQLLNRMDQRA